MARFIKTTFESINASNDVLIGMSRSAMTVFDAVYNSLIARMEHQMECCLNEGGNSRMNPTLGGNLLNHVCRYTVINISETAGWI